MSTRENFSEIKFGKEGYRVITLDEKKKYGEKQTTFGWAILALKHSKTLSH